MKQPVPGKALPPDCTAKDVRRVQEALGPMPREVLAAMVDYGLSDAEISRYFSLPRDLITILRLHWGIADDP